MTVLWREANEVVYELERVVGKHLALGPPDQVRLIKLRVWERRYRILIAEILNVLLPILRSQVRRPKRRAVIGIAVATLTSQAAEKILSEELRKQYPEGENLILWRDRERERQLEAEARDQCDGLMPRKRDLRMLDSDGAADFLKQYEADVLATRERSRKELMQEWRRRKLYRGNPWL